MNRSVKAKNSSSTTAASVVELYFMDELTRTVGSETARRWLASVQTKQRTSNVSFLTEDSFNIVEAPDQSLATAPSAPDDAVARGALMRSSSGSGVFGSSSALVRRSSLPGQIVEGPRSPNISKSGGSSPVATSARERRRSTVEAGSTGDRQGLMYTDCAHVLLSDDD